MDQVLRLEAREGLDSALLRHIRCETRPETAIDRTDRGIANVCIADNVEPAKRVLEEAWAARGKRRGRRPAGAVEFVFGVGPPYQPNPAWEDTIEAAREDRLALLNEKETAARLKAAAAAKEKLSQWVEDSKSWTDERRQLAAQAVVKWLHKAWPDIVIAAAWLHQDETSPHVHALAVAKVGDEMGIRAVRRQLAGLPLKGRVGKNTAVTEMSKVQSAYYEAVGEPFGMARGQIGSAARHQKIDRNRAAAAKLREAQKLREQLAAERKALEVEREQLKRDRAAAREAAAMRQEIEPAWAAAKEAATAAEADRVQAADDRDQARQDREAGGLLSRRGRELRTRNAELEQWGTALAEKLEEAQAQRKIEAERIRKEHQQMLQKERNLRKAAEREAAAAVEKRKVEAERIRKEHQQMLREERNLRKAAEREAATAVEERKAWFEGGVTFALAAAATWFRPEHRESFLKGFRILSDGALGRFFKREGPTTDLPVYDSGLELIGLHKKAGGEHQAGRSPANGQRQLG